MSTQAICSEAFVGGFRPEPELLVSEWADKYRIVGKPSPEPGPWSTDRVPYTREMMDNLSPSSPVEITVLMKAAQGAGTEVGLNALGCWMHRYPDAIMYVLPTVNAAKRFVRTRLDPYFAVNPELTAILSPARSRGGSNTVSLKEFGGGENLVIVGANSGPDARSYPSRYLAMDEVDGYPPDLDDEGETTELFIQRTAAYPNRKILMLSTPTIDEISLISRWFKRGDQRYYHVPCPLCGEMQRLVWRAEDGRPGGLVWPKGEPQKAQYQCCHCGDPWEEWRKIDALKRGEWVATATLTADVKIRSYQVSALYYPYGWPGSKWSNLASQWDSDHRDPLKLKTFVNLKLGEPWRDPAEAKADADTLLSRCEAYGPEVPTGAGVLTVGVDVQANRLEAELVAWGRDEESWSIEYRVFLGDTSKPEVWHELDGFLVGQWMSEVGIFLTVSACCVDAGYQTQTVAQFCASRFSRKVWATFGRAGTRPIWPRKPTRSRVAKSPTFIVGVDSAKENIYARLRLASPGPGFLHFPKGRDRDYFEQLTSEIRVPDYSGPIPKFAWKKRQAGARNEVLDARVLSYAALCGLQSGSLRLNNEVDRLRQMAEASRPQVPALGINPAWANPKPIYSSDPYL